MRDARPEGSPYPKADLTLRGLARAFDLALSFAVASLAGPAGPFLAFLYLLVADGLHHGQSLGKRIFGIRTMVLPRGATVLEAGDEILALVDEPGRDSLAQLLGRPSDDGARPPATR